MLSEFVSNKRDINLLIKFLHYLVYPFLTGFLLDLPWAQQLVISITFFIATAVVHDFIDALLSLWQAVAVAGLVFVLFDYASDTALNQTACALSIPIVWLCILVFKRKFSGVGDSALPNRLQPEIVGVISIALLSLVVPRGQLQNLSFLAKGEDSAQYLMASTTLLRGQDFQLVTGFGASSFLYFYNFFNNGFLNLSKLSADSETSSLLIALNVLSNAWVFVLVSSILFTIRIVSLIRHKVSSESSNLVLYVLISVSSFLFFRASHVVGHFTQYLLNCAVLVFLISLITLSKEASFLPKLASVFLTISTAVSLFGSYGPWLPMTIIAIALIINTFFHRSLLRSVFNSKYWFVMVLIFVPGWALMLRKLYASSNLEMGGGVTVIPLEAVWLVSVLSVIFLGSLFIRKFEKSVVSTESQLNVVKSETLVILATAILMSIAIMDKTSFNQVTTISFLVLIGLCLRPVSVSNLVRNFESITVHKEFDGLFILAVTTFLYTLSIYVLARFIGPIYEPMYAANKSMFAFFGQFSWLMILLVFSSSKLLSRITRITREVLLFSSLLIVLGLTNFTRSDETQGQWWHEPSLVALNEDPETLIACVNPVLTRDYESYKCNRFMNTLTNHGYSATSFMGVALGDPPAGITDWFNRDGPKNGVKFEDLTEVIVLSQDKLGAGALGIFEGVPKNMIDFRVIGP